MGFEIPSVVPDFMIVGAPKCATTSLSAYVQHYDEVFISPIKEPRYFLDIQSQRLAGPGDEQWAASAIVEPHSYAALFSARAAEQVAGEASVDYFVEPAVPARLYRANPHLRLVAILRDPVERAWSHFLHHRVRQVEPEESFRTAYDLSEVRLEDGWSSRWAYAQASRYFEQLDRFCQLFPDEQVLLIDFHRLAIDPVTVAWEVARFVSDKDLARKPFRAEKRNVGSGIGRRRLGTMPRRVAQTVPGRLRHRAPTWIRRAGRQALHLLSAPAPEVPGDVASYLLRELAPDVRELSRRFPSFHAHFLARYH